MSENEKRLLETLIELTRDMDTPRSTRASRAWDKARAIVRELDRGTLDTCKCGGQLFALVKTETRFRRGEAVTDTGSRSVWCDVCDAFSDNKAPDWCDLEGTIDHHLNHGRRATK